MKRNVWCLLGTVALLGGCMKPAMDADAMKKPAPPEQMKQLERMVGNWTWTGEMVEPSKEEMMKYLAKDAKPPETSFLGTGKTEMVLGGVALKSTGNFELEGQKMTYEEYMWWDGKAGKFRTWSMNDWGEIGSGWMTSCGDCDGFCSKADAIDAHGNKKRFEGCMKFIDKDTHEWTFTEHGPMGRMTMKGTSKRTK